MIKKILICFYCIVLVSCEPEPNAVPQPDDNRITIGQRFTIESETLGEDRPYSVYLPASYNNGSAQRYPVMYLLDGDGHFPSTSGVVHFMSSGINGNVQVPELIVVAIPNTNRTRDLTPSHSTTGFDGEEAQGLAESGGGDAFLNFVRDELFEKIDADYRTASHRTLVGHSLGGLLASYTLLNRPDMFQAYIVIDPSLWWDEQSLVRQARKIGAKGHDIRASVYISLANSTNVETGETSLMEKAGREFADILASGEYPGVRSTLQYFEAEDHGSVPLLSIYHGLLATFDGYKFGFGDFMANPSISSVKTHFDGVSERTGIDPEPPESLVNMLGYLLLYTVEDLDMATEMFELNVTNYPASPNVYDSLGEAHMVNGDKQLAIDNYEKVLVLDPDNVNATQQIELLKGKE